jgi:hypothetical protein
MIWSAAIILFPELQQYFGQHYFREDGKVRTAVTLWLVAQDFYQQGIV